MTTMDRLLAEAMGLSDAERAELVSRISESVPNIEAELAWREECLRRATEHDADPESSLSWDDAMETIFTTIKQ